MSRFQQTPFPQQVVIEVTAGCNQQCIFCGRTYMDRPKKTMKPDLYRKIVDEIARESPLTEVWPTFMGEALLLGDRLFELLRYTKEVGCEKLTLNTNGTRLERYAEEVTTCGLDRLIVSCDAHTPETHRKVRPIMPSAKEKEGLVGIYRGIERVLEIMRSRNAVRPLVELQFSIFDENEHEVDEFVKHWLARNVVVKTRPKLFWSGTVAEGDHRAKLGRDREPCLWSLETCGIHWNGNVVMCVVDCEGKYVAGNVECQTLQSIWDAPLRWIRELHLRKRFAELPEICRKCPDWQVKRARAYFPTAELQEAYEAYIRKGRLFMQEHTGPSDEALYVGPKRAPGRPGV